MGAVTDMTEARDRLDRLNAIRRVERIERARGILIPRSLRVVVTDYMTGGYHCISPCVPPPEWEADALIGASQPNP